MDEGGQPPLELMRDLEREGALSLDDVAQNIAEIVFISRPYDRCPVCTVSTRSCPRHSLTPLDDEFCIWCFADRRRSATIVPARMHSGCQHRFHRPCLLLWSLYLCQFRRLFACPEESCDTQFREVLMCRDVKEKSVLLLIPEDLPDLRAAAIENIIQGMRLARFQEGMDLPMDEPDLLFHMQMRFRKAKEETVLLERELAQANVLAYQRAPQPSRIPAAGRADTDAEGGGGDEEVGMEKEFLGAVNWGASDGAEVTASRYGAVIRVANDGDVVLSDPGDEVMDFDED